MKKIIQLIDKPTFLGSLILLFSVTLPLLIFPDQGELWVKAAKTFMTDELGFLYLAIGLTALFFMVYIIFSDIGQIKLGNPDEKPEFNTLSWASMMFCGGIGASILYWGTIEWAYYYLQPPFQLPPGSNAAIRWATTYGLFHWGPIAWSIYLVPALPIAYFFYVRKQPILKVSTSLMPVLGEARVRGPLGKLIDVLFIFGMLGGAATTLGLASPLITEGLNHLFGIPKSLAVQITILMVCTAIFAWSAYAGLKKGIQFLSNINMWGALILLAFVLITGPTVFMLETGLDSLGKMLSNFFLMATWTEPFARYENFDQTHFPQDWTIFYWAWWLVFAPSVGLFIARISRGRTIKQMVAGSIFFGSLGCFLFFIILGNYGLSLQLTGQVDVIDILQNQTPTAAIFAILDQLPLSTLVIALFTLLCIIFTATTFDSISYILAAVVQNNVTEEPMRWNRLFWAFTLSFLPAVLMFIGGLSTLQTAAIVGGMPLLFIIGLQMISVVKAASFDLKNQNDYIDPVINIMETGDIDPWSTEGIALAKFEQQRDEAMEAAEQERCLRNEIFDVRKQIRAYALEHDQSGNTPQKPEELITRLKSLLNELQAAQQKKQLTSSNAQKARMAFDQLIREKKLHIHGH